MITHGVQFTLQCRNAQPISLRIYDVAQEQSDYDVIFVIMSQVKKCTGPLRSYSSDKARNRLFK